MSHCCEKVATPLCRPTLQPQFSQQQPEKSVSSKSRQRKVSTGQPSPANHGAQGRSTQSRVGTEMLSKLIFPNAAKLVETQSRQRQLFGEVMKEATSDRYCTPPACVEQTRNMCRGQQNMALKPRKVLLSQCPSFTGLRRSTDVINH